MSLNRSKRIFHFTQIKQTAEQFFYGFVQSPQMPLIIDLIQRGSNLLVFALFSYMGKYPQPFVY